MIRTLLIDDEMPARSRMRRLLKDVLDIEIIGEAANGLEALEMIAQLNPDLVFLDVEMPELSGLGVAAALMDEPKAPLIVFVTAYDEHALKAFEVAAVDYLVKPVDPSRLEAAIKKIRGRTAATSDLAALIKTIAQPSPRLAVKCGSRYVVVDTARIAAVVARDHYAAILIDGRELLTDVSLDVLSSRFDPTKFLRIHRSGIINLDYLQELEHLDDRKYNAVLRDPHKTKIPISRERLDELKRRVGISR